MLLTHAANFYSSSPLGVVEKAQFGIQSNPGSNDGQRVIISMFTFLIWSNRAEAPIPRYHWRISKVTYSKFLIIITNLSAIHYTLGLFSLVIPATFYENENIIHSIQKRNIREICDLINVKQLEKEAQIKPMWGWLQNLCIYPTWCFLPCRHSVGTLQTSVPSLLPILGFLESMIWSPPVKSMAA